MSLFHLSPTTSALFRGTCDPRAVSKRLVIVEFARKRVKRGGLGGSALSAGGRGQNWAE
jgi:hypothetical protein